MGGQSYICVMHYNFPKHFHSHYLLRTRSLILARRALWGSQTNSVCISHSRREIKQGLCNLLKVKQWLGFCVSFQWYSAFIMLLFTILWWLSSLIHRIFLTKLVKQTPPTTHQSKGSNIFSQFTHDLITSVPSEQPTLWVRENMIRRCLAITLF